MLVTFDLEVLEVGQGDDLLVVGSAIDEAKAEGPKVRSECLDELENALRRPRRPYLEGAQGRKAKVGEPRRVGSPVASRLRIRIGQSQLFEVHQRLHSLAKADSLLREVDRGIAGDLE